MKSIKRIITTSVFIFTITLLSAQIAPPPNNGGGDVSKTPEQGGNTPVGGGAPIGGGLFILLGLGAAYGAKKLFEKKKEN